MTRSHPLVVIIRDGWGQNPHPEHNPFNAIHQAKTKVADGLHRDWPTTLIHTSGQDVGLPDNTMGNSEVGHQNIGAGRIVDQACMRISNAVKDGSFLERKALIGAFEHAKRNSTRVHVMGLVSDGRVHSDQIHLHAIVDLAMRLGVSRDGLCIHAFTDGRDTSPKLGLGFIQKLERHLQGNGVGVISSVCGRYYAMDRDHRWDRVSKAYGCLTARGMASDDSAASTSAESAIEAYYANPSETSRTGDEFVLPTRIEGTPRIEDGDSVIFFNYRGDRPRELSKAFIFDDSKWGAIQGGGFDRGKRLNDLHFVTMCAYEEGLPVEVVFEKPEAMPSILGEVMANASLSQFRCAETEKFPHVTFFFNDYREPPFPGETRQILQSPKDVSTYDKKPEMAAYQVRDAVLARLRAKDTEDLIIVNFANGDMVGHTGVLEATITAIETVDGCVGEIVEETLKKGGTLIITADHGNAEQLWDPESNSPHTAHTTYDVPLHIVGDAFRNHRRVLIDGGRLADIAPTALAIMGLEQPQAMTGRSLIAD